RCGRPEDFQTLISSRKGFCSGIDKWRASRHARRDRTSTNPQSLETIQLGRGRSEGRSCEARDEKVHSPAENEQARHLTSFLVVALPLFLREALAPNAFFVSARKLAGYQLAGTGTLTLPSESSHAGGYFQTSE